FSFKVPIVIDADNVIICGHTRYKAAQKLHLESVPCIVADDLTPAQVKAFRLADNKVSELAEWDDAFLLDELDDLELFNIDMSDFGFDTSKIGSWHKSWAKTEKYCDLKKKIKSRSAGDMIFTSFYQVGKKGITIAQIKEQPTNAKIFADNLCDYLMCIAGNNLVKGDWCIVTTPRRRHKDGFHFSTEICRQAAENLRLPFYEDAFIAENNSRIEPDFRLITNPKETNIILYDDIISTGVTLKTCRQLLLDAGHVVFLCVGIRNQAVGKT
ncbi:MAG: hypothetical protein IKP64_06245, partial [Selenomonadaceae bacterium]|nr:hypothetical protein [Selenomonadaceae bacterium]